MYRIELAPGEVTVFRTIEELATGVRNGVITPKARIYHSSSQKWLPVEFHPHYKAALELLSGKTSEIPLPAPKPAERPSFDKLSFLHPPATHAPTPAAPAAAPHPPSPAPHTISAAVPKPPAVESKPPAVESKPATIEVKPAVEEPASEAPAEWWRARPHVQAAPSSGPVQGDQRTPSPRIRGSVLPAPFVATPIEERPAEHRATPERVFEPIFEEPASAPRPALPPVSASPVLELPKIAYPEFRPVEEPVAERGVSSGRRRRPSQVGVALVVLAVGGFGATRVFAPAAEPTSRSAAVERPVAPVEARPATSATAGPVSVPTPSPAPRAAAIPSAAAPAAGATVSKPDVPLPPASSGFAPALEPRAIVAAPKATTPKSATPDSVVGIAPAAIDMNVAVPALPGADAFTGVQRHQDDSAIKKILRALNGGKDLPARR